MGAIAMAMRMIPMKLPTFEELGLPPESGTDSATRRAFARIAARHAFALPVPKDGANPAVPGAATVPTTVSKLAKAYSNITKNFLETVIQSSS